MVSIEKTTRDGRSLLIREGEGGDAEAVLSYLALVSRETNFLTFGPDEFKLTQNEENRYLEKFRSTENCIFLLALVDAELAGILTFEASPRRRIRHTGEFGISVLEAYWGQGVASALIDAMLAWAQDGGVVKKINLRVRADNQRAIGLYERKGFAVEGHLKKEFFLDGTYLDNYWMGLEL